MVAQTQSRLAPWCLARSAVILLCCLLGGRQQHQSFTGGHTPASADVLRHILTEFAQAQVSPEAWVLSLEVKEWLWCGAEGFASPWGDQYVHTTTGEEPCSASKYSILELWDGCFTLEHQTYRNDCTPLSPRLRPLSTQSSRDELFLLCPHDHTVCVFCNLQAIKGIW